MRWHLAILVTVLLLPVASAASQVHVTYLGDEYSVTFESSALLPSLRLDGSPALAQRVTEPSGDDDRLFRARLPARDLTYEVDGREFSLAAPPAPEETTRIVFVADIGTDANASRVLDAIIKAKPDLVVIGGDLSYANANASVWNKWFDLIEPLAARVPVMPAYGNHEDYCEGPDHDLDHCGPDRNGWHAHFELPNENNLYYAFDWGPVRFTVLDTEAYESSESVTDADAQEGFLNESLAKNDSLWDVVVYHRPLRTTNAREGIESANARRALGPLIDGRADVALQAHLHAYERSKAGPNETLYITSGGGGRPLYANWGAETDWLAKRTAEFHFLVIDAGPYKLDIKAIRPDGTTLDSVALERPRLPAPPTTAVTPTMATSHWTTSWGVPSQDIEPNESQANDTPGPSFALLVTALTLSARLTMRRARE